MNTTDRSYTETQCFLLIYNAKKTMINFLYSRRGHVFDGHAYMHWKEAGCTVTVHCIGAKVIYCNTELYLLSQSYNHCSE